MTDSHPLDPRRFLALPWAYDAFQTVVGANYARKRFFDQHVLPYKPSRVLEVGCGTGTNCKLLPRGIEYVGCDPTPEYLEHARRKYGYRAQFYAKGVGELEELNLEPFDIILAVALLHHLDDVQVDLMCSEITPLLKPGGLLITGDPCFVKNQAPLEHFIVANDRGRFVRFPQQYEELLKKRFNSVQTIIERAHSLIPTTAIVMIASRPYPTSRGSA